MRLMPPVRLTSVRALLSAAFPALSLVIILGGCGGAAKMPDPSFDRAQATTAVSTTLDALHVAASKADGERYFGLFTPDAVFVGTDATERWTIPEFRAYAAPHFAAGRGWTYAVVERHVDFAPDGQLAWFHERLDNEKYGAVRGSGVLKHTSSGWRVAQYVLSFPVPNDAAADVIKRIQQ